MYHVLRSMIGGLMCTALLACMCYAESPLGSSQDHDLAARLKHQEEDVNMQMDNALSADQQQQFVKRAWKNLHGGWGKRAWHNLQSAGWGKRPDPYTSWANPGPADKRAWQKFQGGWGKRWIPEDDWTLPEPNDNDGSYDEYAQLPAEFDDLLDEEKRTWRSLTPSWGKRATSDWDSFRGSWGKRDPAWNNLKGLWGKRSMQDRTPAS